MAKIPPQAKCVFKGKIFDVYHWEQQLFDGSFETFEMLKRPDTVLVIPVQGETVFYAHQEQPGRKPFFSLFGGRAEEGEDPLEACKRELLEEAGITSDDWQLLSTHSRINKIDWTVYFYIARNCRTVAEQNLDAGEKIEIKTTTIEQFINEMIPHPQFREKELRDDLMSLFNPAKADALAQALRGK